MNFNHINRNSLMNSLYGSRNSYQSYQPTDTNKLEMTQEHHLNPSKSKVNIKQSLNKTIENCKMNSSIIVDIRNRSFINNNPASTNNQIKNDIMDQDKFFKTGKEPNGSYTDRTFNKENKCKNYQTITPLPIFQEKKKSQSFHTRNGSGTELRFKVQEDKRNAENDRQNNYIEINVLLQSLSKRVINNQQEIFKIKQKIQKQKSAKNIDNQLLQLKNKIGQFVKLNEKRENDFDGRILQHQKELLTLKELITHKESNIYKNSLKINKIEQTIRQIKQFSIENLSNQIQNIKLNVMNKINKEIQSISNKLEKNNQEILVFNTKIATYDRQINQKSKQYKKSNKMAFNSIMLQNRQILNINSIDQIQKSKGSRSLIIKQKYYYIDSFGYLLDENKFYLLNKNNQQIMINDRLLQILKQNNILMKSNLKI